MSHTPSEPHRGGIHVEHQGWLEDARANAMEFDALASNADVLRVVTTPDKIGRTQSRMLRCDRDGGHDAGVRVGARMRGGLTLEFWPSTSVERDGLASAMSASHPERERVTRGARLHITCRKCGATFDRRPGPLLGALETAIRLSHPYVPLRKRRA